MNYTIIAYKPSYSTRCGDFYGSDFEMKTSQDIEDAKHYASNYYHEKMVGEDSWEVTILYDGIERREYDYELQDDIPDIENDAYSMALEKHKAYKERKEKELQDSMEREKERKKQADLALLEKLKKQYGQ
jgi:hypothetical protein